MYTVLILLALMLPLVLLIVGLIFYKFPPKDINYLSGYRTTRSMKNIKTWNEANKYSAKLMIKFSLITLIITVLSLILAGKSYNKLTFAIIVSTTLSIIFLILVIILTEKHLKNMFEV